MMVKRGFGEKRIIEDLVKYFLRNMPEPDIYEA